MEALIIILAVLLSGTLDYFALRLVFFGASAASPFATFTAFLTVFFAVAMVYSNMSGPQR